jgi:lysophospholipid acyltransferase (LPLAT)-like uncharacterized protein
MSDFAARIGVGAARVIGGGALRLLAASLRIEQVGWNRVAEIRRHGPVIVAFWHARFLVLPFAYPHNRPVGLLISPSRDGDILAGVMQTLRREPIRGSSRRGGREALAELDDAVRRGWDAAIAVDGPAGPALHAKAGTARLAQRTGAPIVPVVYGARRGWYLKTWDRFLIPAPFSRVRVLWGEPLRVAPTDDIPTVTAQLDHALRGLLGTVDADLRAATQR